MEHQNKRVRITKDSIVDDISSSISGISNSIESISGNYRALLKVNKTVVSFLQGVKKQKEELSIEPIETDFERSADINEQ